jgi:hypothetical protein
MNAIWFAIWSECLTNKMKAFKEKVESICTIRYELSNLVKPSATGRNEQSKCKLKIINRTRPEQVPNCF